jgi:hypothetical protein
MDITGEKILIRYTYKQITGKWITDWDSENIDDYKLAIGACVRIEEDLLTRNFILNFEKYKNEEEYESLNLFDFVRLHQCYELINEDDDVEDDEIEDNNIENDDIEDDAIEDNNIEDAYIKDILNKLKNDDDEVITKVERDFSRKNIVINCSQTSWSYEIRAKWRTNWSSRDSNQSLKARRVCEFIEEDLLRSRMDLTFRKYKTGYPIYEHKGIIFDEFNGNIVINYSYKDINGTWITDWEIVSSFDRFSAESASWELLKDLENGDLDPTFEKYKCSRTSFRTQYLSSKAEKSSSQIE